MIYEHFMKCQQPHLETEMIQFSPVLVKKKSSSNQNHERKILLDECWYGMALAHLKKSDAILYCCICMTGFQAPWQSQI